MTEKPAPDVVEAGKPHPLSQIWADAFHAWEKDGHWAACESLAAALQARPDAALAGLSQAIRIAIWNTAKWQGMPESVAYSFIDHAMNEPTILSALRTHNDTLEDVVQIYAWLGYWRDQIPAEAVSQLQNILGPFERKDRT